MLATPVLATGATVAGLYYLRRGRSDAATVTQPHFRRQHQAPNTWLEALYFLAETLRFTYGETLGRWKTGDLLIGLLYLARKDAGTALYQEIRAKRAPLGLEGPLAERQAFVEELLMVRRFMTYCRAMRERRPAAQQRVLARLGVAPEDVLFQANRAGVLRPSHCIVRDAPAKAIVLVIRGTTSLKDLFTSLTGASKPHHVVDGSGVVLGHCHFGILAAARWVLQERAGLLARLLEENPGYRLMLTGHSLGAGTAALLTMMLRAAGPQFRGAVCYAVACPACATLELAQSCAGYVTSIMNATDLVPTLSPAAADALREEVLLSSWSATLRGELRRSAVFRVLEGTLARVGSAASAASTWTSAGLASATTRMRACYARPAFPHQSPPQKLKRTSSASGLQRSKSEGFSELEPAARVQVLLPDEEGAASATGPLSPPQAQSDMEGVSGSEDGDSAEGEGPGSPDGGQGGGPLPSGGVQRRQSVQESLEDVHAAVEAEERLEAAEGEPPLAPGRPAGAAGRAAGAAQQQGPRAAGPSAPSGEQAEQPRRFMYPAGRIWHLVPATDVPPEEGETDSGGSMPESSPSPGPEAEAGPRSEMSAEDRERERQVSSLAHALALAGMDESLTLTGDPLEGGSPRGAPPPPVRDFHVYRTQQEDYGRVRLCKTALADHFVPAHLASLDSALHILRQGLLAKASPD